MLLEENCQFETDRLHITNWPIYFSKASDQFSISERVIEILQPEVTSALPPGWQNISSSDQANDWMAERVEESAVFAIELIEDKLLVGFIFLTGESASESHQIDVRLGYLLAKETWGKGLGTELIAGLVNQCSKSGKIASVSGGVEFENKASIRVLEKNGFVQSEKEDSPKGTVFLTKRF